MVGTPPEMPAGGIRLCWRISRRCGKYWEMNETPYNPAVLRVLLVSTLAAVVAALGALPALGRDRVPPRWSALAYALASGLMVGAGYILMTEGLDLATMPAVLGAGLGVVYTYWTHAFSGTIDLTARPSNIARADYSIKFILLNSLHSASEGIAIGVAMVVGIRLGVFLAAALAIHNVAEAMVLTDILRSRRETLPHAAGTAIISKVPQILLAIVVFSVVPAIPAVLPSTLGFAAGAMVYLVMTELLPYSYARAERTAIAFVVSFTIGVIVLLRGFFG